MTNWKKVKLGDVIEINPTVSLKGGNAYSFIEMADLSDGQKFTYPSTKKVLTGGARFKEGDTLFARITPCLENGKICQAKNLDNGVGFGSTEFLVFRGKEGISNSDFVFYLSRTEYIRKYAEQNLVGTSGRQRVAASVFYDLEIDLPDLPTQSRIASILSALDDKIELNRQMNHTLEQMAQALFKHWFIEYEFPNENGKNYNSSDGEMKDGGELGEIPKDFIIRSVYELGNYVNGAAYKNMHFSNSIDALPVIKIVELKYGITQTTKFTSTNLGEKYKIKTGDILFSWSGSPETSIDTFLWVSGSAWLNQHIFKIVPDSIEMRTYIYFLLKFLNPIFVEIAKNKQTTGLGHVTISDLRKLTVAFPSRNVLSRFSSIATPILDIIQNNLEQLDTLKRLRDSLLPKLMSGEIEIKEAETILA